MGEEEADGRLLVVIRGRPQRRAAILQRLVCVDRRVSERLALGWATCTLVTSATDDEERAS